MLLAHHQSWRSAWSVFKESVAKTFTHWKIVCVLWAIQIGLLVLILYCNFGLPDTSTFGIWLNALVSVALTVFQLIFTGVLVFLAADKRQRSVTRILRESVLLKLPALLVLAVLLWVILMVSTLAFVIPGVILYVYLCLSAFILLQEDAGVFASLRKSVEYVRGWWWPLFARNLFIFTLFTLVTFISIVPIAGFLISSLLSLFFAPALVFYYQATYEEMVQIKSYAHLKEAQVTWPAKTVLILWSAVLLVSFSVFALASSYVAEVGQIPPLYYYETSKGAMNALAPDTTTTTPATTLSPNDTGPEAEPTFVPPTITPPPAATTR